MIIDSFTSIIIMLILPTLLFVGFINLTFELLVKLSLRSFKEKLVITWCLLFGKLK